MRVADKDQASLFRNDTSRGDPSRGELLSSEQFGQGGDDPIDLDEDDDIDSELISKDDQSLE